VRTGGSGTQSLKHACGWGWNPHSRRVKNPTDLAWAISIGANISLLSLVLLCGSVIRKSE